MSTTEDRSGDGSGTASVARVDTKLESVVIPVSDVDRAAAHGEHEKRTGQRDDNWPAWYAAYMVAEQAGTELPT